MNTKAKLITKFLQNPISLRYSQIEKILISHGWEKIQGKGSHVLFEKPGMYDISVPIHNNECKIIYKKQIAKILNKFLFSQS